MGQNYNYEAGIPSTFTITPAQVGTSNTVTLTITDTGYALTTVKMIKAVLKNAIEAWVAADSADLVTNGDTAITTDLEDTRRGDGYENWTFDYSNKLCKVTLTAVTNINVSSTFTVSSPFKYSH